MVARVGDVILAKPLTFMNNSGLAVGALLRFYKLAPKTFGSSTMTSIFLWVKSAYGSAGSAGGHHGIESIIAVVKSDAFVRFRMGIGRGRGDG